MQKRFLSFEELVALTKRRGFFYQSSDIYGGLAGFYDFGPLGVELANNLKHAWWQDTVHLRHDVEGLDSASILHRQALKNSGHEDTFSDPLVDCLNCKKRLRSDHVKNNTCSYCGGKELTQPKDFNLMLKTALGPTANLETDYSYLRPETAQGIFINYKNILSSANKKLPFGIAQIGKAYRNEITPRHFIFRVREFTQMELEFFVDQAEDETWFNYWVDKRYNWWVKQGINADKLHKAVQTKEELAHYSKATVDLTFDFPHGNDELEGIANRTDYDLNCHFPSLKDKPYVIEPSAGLERGIFALLSSSAICETDPTTNKSRIVTLFKPHLAPIKAAIIPLAKNNKDIVALAKKLFEQVVGLGLGRIRYEDTGNIGKAYLRNDEIGTPICITIDFESLEQETVTIRNRDDKTQQSIKISKLKEFLLNFYNDAKLTS